MSNLPLVVSLAEAKAAAAVGGKAAALGELLRAGFPVPPGFCITAPAFRRFLEANDFGPALAELLSEQMTGLPDWPERAAAKLQSLFRLGRIPEDLEEQILAAYDRLPGEGAAVVAVRSSALDEDSAALSFAGQHDSFLGVQGREDLLRRIRDCWASLWSPRALAYRRDRGALSSALALAVVVQVLVPAEVGGVAFTSNPRDGSREEIVINSAWGLAEAVCSGRLAPDEDVVSKQPRKIRRREISEKTFRIVPGPGGTREEPVPEELRRRPCLEEAALLELADLAVRVEEHAGEPRDLEWAWAGGRFYLLQSRPITAPAGEVQGWEYELNTPGDPRYPEYTRGNIGEILPGLVTPLTWSYAGANLEAAFRRTPLEAGLFHPPPDLEFLVLGYFYGRMYLNLSFFREMAERMPGTSPEAVDEELLGVRRREHAGRSLGQMLKLRSWRQNLGLAPQLLRLALFLDRDLATLRRRVQDYLQEEKVKDPTRFTPDQLAGEIGASAASIQRTYVHITVSEFSAVYFDVLRQLTKRWLDDPEGMLAARCLTGVQEMVSARPAAEIHRLAQMVREQPELSRLFEQWGDEEILARIQEARQGPVRSLALAWKNFLDEFGYRGVSEAEISIPTWGEDPTQVLAHLRNCLRAGEGPGPEAARRRQEEEQAKATAEVYRRLSFWKGWLFRRVLARARKYTAAREEVKSYLVRLNYHKRKYYREIGNRLVAQGRLEQMEDIYFLLASELKAAIQGREPDEPLRARVRRRRAGFARCKNYDAPHVFLRRDLPWPPRREAVDAKAEKLLGIGVSPGWYRGPARVVLDPRQTLAIAPGEVLVAPVTDVGWTPLFLHAGALVVDVGGLLSHGSVVAREYGIPAVVNVKNGTRLIRTGDLVTVDGKAGEVYLEKPKEAT
jgi:pyruvate,water dikinase